MNAQQVAERSAMYALQEAVTPMAGDAFELMATAPQGVAKLRELILSLAVRGRLVAHDPRDESAEILFEKIQQEKSEQAAHRELKRGRLRAQVEEAAMPFELPANWRWTRLGDAANKITDGTHHSPPNTAQGDFRYISAKNIKPWGIDLSNVTYVTRSVHEEIYARCDPVLGDVLYIKDGATTGVVTINSLAEPFSMLSSVALLKPSCGLTSEFLIRVMASPFFYTEMRAGMTGVAITRVTLGKLEDALIPLPPLAEQRRIVARVEELMGLCDELEAHGRLQDEQHTRLLATLFDALLASASPKELAGNWQRVANHFDLLLDRPEAIDALEQTILQLAVRGLLVPQDSTYEPASVLIARIRAEKAKLAKAGELKQTKVLRPVTESDCTFNVPTSWTWARLGELVNHSEAGWSPRCDEGQRRGGAWGVLKVSAVSWGEFRSHENKQLPATLKARAEYEVRDGDFLISRANTVELVARSVVAQNPEPRLMLSDKLIRLKISALVDHLYVNLVNNAQFARAYYAENASGTSGSMKNVSREVILNLPVPLPPPAEQRRIVARVEELRALCADLRKHLQQAQATRSHLAEALVARAVA